VYEGVGSVAGVVVWYATAMRLPFAVDEDGDGGHPTAIFNLCRMAFRTLLADLASGFFSSMASKRMVVQPKWRRASGTRSWFSRGKKMYTTAMRTMASNVPKKRQKLGHGETGLAG
jgi:hypothetical protein